MEKKKKKTAAGFETEKKNIKNHKKINKAFCTLIRLGLLLLSAEELKSAGNISKAPSGTAPELAVAASPSELVAG